MSKFPNGKLLYLFNYKQNVVQRLFSLTFIWDILVYMLSFFNTLCFLVFQETFLLGLFIKVLPNSTSKGWDLGMNPSVSVKSASQVST